MVRIVFEADVCFSAFLERGEQQTDRERGCHSCKPWRDSWKRKVSFCPPGEDTRERRWAGPYLVGAGYRVQVTGVPYDVLKQARCECVCVSLCVPLFRAPGLCLVSSLAIRLVWFSNGVSKNRLAWQPPPPPPPDRQTDRQRAPPNWRAHGVGPAGHPVVSPVVGCQDAVV